MSEERITLVLKIILMLKWTVFLILSLVLTGILFLIEKSTQFVFVKFLSYDEEMRFDNKIGIVEKFKGYRQRS